MKWRALTLLVAMTVSLSALGAMPTVVLVITESNIDSSPLIWWRCSKKRPDLPITEVLAAHLRRSGLKVISDCSQLNDPLHSTYHKPKLGRQDAINLGNAIGADRVVYGVVQRLAKDTDALAKSIGLQRQDISATITAVDLITEKTLDSITAKASGFATSARSAGESASRLVLSDLIRRLPKFTQKSAVSSRYLQVRLAGLSITALDTLVRTLKTKRAVRTVDLIRLDTQAATLQISPTTSRAKIERYLKNAGVKFSITP